MNILFTLLIQKPIDFTRQDLSKDGSYEKVDAERLYLLEENKKTGNALYILDGKTTDFIFYLLSMELFAIVQLAKKS